MAKRNRSSDDDFDSDASYAEPMRKAVRRGKAKSARKAKGKGRRAASTPGDEEACAEHERVFVHSNAFHRVTDAAALRGPLLDWYLGVHEVRGMPWRKPFDPSLDAEGRAQRAYEVWISEIMLQQTQVATVIPYYNRWMDKFPTIKHLAASDIETVNALWKGLGYYSRAARLLEGAKKAVHELGGRLPDNAKNMEAQIPGIGRYSAGAICSIAYNQCAPVLDGNVHRLLSRVVALHASPKSKATLDILWAGATAVVEGCDCPGDVNQALIELGSTVCKPRDPDCAACPLRAICKAYIRHSPATHKPADDLPDIEDLNTCTLCEPLPAGCTVTSYPMKAERKKAREELDVVNVVEWRHPHTHARWFLLVRRPEGGLLAGLYEFPTVPNTSGTLSAVAMRDIPHKVLGTLLAQPVSPFVRPQQQRRPAAGPADELRIASIKQAGDVTHVFSHIKKTYRTQWVLLEGGGDTPPLLVQSDDRSVSKKRKKQPGRTNGAESRKGTSSLASVGGSGDDAVPVSSSAATIASGLPTARWLLMEDVPHANIGTGVLKIWKQVSSVWDESGYVSTSE